MSAKSFRYYPYLVSAIFVVFITLFGELVKRNLEPTNLVMFYLLAVVISAIWWGRGPAIMTSVLSVIAFDFFLVPPYLTFTVADVQYLFTFAALLIVGVVISTLASKAREQVIRRETEKLQTALLNSISHDLRTPLVSIKGVLSSLLQESSLDEETRKEILETAHEDSDRLNRIVGNLLDMARLEADVIKVSSSPCEVRDVIGSALKELEDRLMDRKVTINIQEGLPHISMDFRLIMKVLTNLIDNAIKYAPFGLPIDIDAKENDGRIEIKVMDRGLGIPAGDLEHVFDKFYRVKRPQNIEGSGLGLSICKGMIEAHKGKIWAENRSGGGTIVTISLPVKS